MDEKDYQAKVRNVAVPAVYLILNNWTDKILLALRQNTGYQDGNWELPAGHVEDGELPSEAAAREGKEELGIIIDPTSLKMVHSSYRPAHDKTGSRTDYIFEANRWSNVPHVCEKNKCEKIDWFNPTGIPKNTIPHIREFIKCWKQGVPFSEFSLAWLKENGLYKL